MTPLDFRNTNALWCSVLAETLVRCGVTQAVISPGSRSTPLTMALARHPGVEAVPVLDERSAAFFALGLAKQKGRPVVLVCTSGTAGANYYPAVIEAHESGVPLIVITADRPAEMRDCSSGQTIDQQKLFGGFVTFYHELAVPQADVTLLRYLRQTVVHATDRALRGPVHLNAPFRDPLPPIADETAKALESHDWEAFFTEFLAPKPEPFMGVTLPHKGRGIVIAGPAQSTDAEAWSEAVWRFAKQRGWPVLADALNPLRSHASHETTMITAYDAILRSGTMAEKLKPDFIVCVENWPTSKVLRTWIDGLGVPVLLLTASDRNGDALHAPTRWVRCGIEDVLSAPAGDIAADVRTYTAVWGAAERAARRVIDASMADAAAFEGRIVWELAQKLPGGTPLFIANSMPVRDAEYFWPANDRELRVFVNRGANGIDGTLSTAMGVAHGNAPAVLLTGDLALLHDANGFLSVPRFNGSLTIVLVNNNGGGIFNHLPIAQFEQEFEKYWATPQSVDFARLCAAYGVSHTLVADAASLAEIAVKLPVRGVRVLEVCTDRNQDAAFRKKLFADVAAALG
ncbi:2-succinyl-5-enolpyruvyl-6-hydroxy-3-cyclohexene-1-carboxylic-acid synthase [Rariglobus hedericola]|uniref:2-succinyl-5-enolpyruvyl-6-hydroxy-3-cyclohexene-1-carboxylate synthase n=1 Tax=Rariglobus hedericola TaxID=2597822 RepID=A0A556QNM0_9BACT|nr:2-succinyl-5-enolpyruvyl-6-hydroxy-3-cyclohexene-1-carboxylic-acid synthase [Rariglobus hedericola]TSJ78235.1 2-succinyl-5-enolpyruvyl-6-hydroxy-3-cyclohexene-1-carboxylic-acid synthase [Rariglobus hedericola]